MREKSLFIVLIVGLALLAVSCCTNQETEDSDTDALAKMLELHERQRAAHLTYDVEAIVDLLAQDYLNVQNGEVTRRSEEDNRKRFEDYFGSVEFSEWDDIEEPRFLFSDDRSMAVAIETKRVTLRPKGAAEGQEESTTEFAWISVFQKRDGKWEITAIASTRKPE